MKLLTEGARQQRMTQGVRDLFAAGWLGEQMFAQLGLHRAVAVLEDPEERSKVIGASWKAERPFGAPILAGLGIVSVASLFTAARSGSKLDVAASACALGAVGASISCAVVGRTLQNEPIETGFRSTPDTPERGQTAQRFLSVMAPVGMILGLASIGLSVASHID